jgi:UDP-GlcNAc:undecaprenyl-phosphate/decaprenyl-phosphate GlcNAc-1-phosphate transferase
LDNTTDHYMQTLTTGPLWLYIASAALFTVAMIMLLRPLAIRIGLVDIPGGRKQHLGAIPLVGGPAMCLGFLPAYLSATGLNLATVTLTLSATLIVITGMIDDYKDVRAKTKLLLQIGAALGMSTAGGYVISDLGNILGMGSLPLGWIAIPFTVFAMVGVINALNLSDGVDGLGGGLALVTTLSLLGFAVYQGSPEQILTLSILSAAVIGFLIFNFPLPGGRRASVFMGDSGSMFLGLIIACALVKYSQGADRLVRPTTCLWLFALPLFDTVSVMTWRILKGRSPFSAGREHLHHILEHAGYRGFKCTSAVISLAIIYSLIGSLCETGHVPEAVSFSVFLAFFAAHFLVLKKAWKFTKLIKASATHPTSSYQLRNPLKAADEGAH